MYFVTLMFGVGLVGTWFAIWSAWSKGKLSSEVPDSLATYAIAVVASTFAEVVLNWTGKQNSPKEIFAEATFRMLALTIVVGVVATSLVALNIATDHPRLATVMALCSSVASLTLWWIVNAKNPNLSTSPNSPTVPIGGGDEETLNPLSGNLDSITS